MTELYEYPTHPDKACPQCGGKLFYADKVKTMKQSIPKVERHVECEGCDHTAVEPVDNG